MTDSATLLPTAVEVPQGISAAFDVLRSTAEGEKSLLAILEQMGGMVGFVDDLQGRVKEVMQMKDVQYLLAFKEHMTAMSLQLEQLRREVGGGD